MVFKWLFYAVKPVIPRRAQIFLRRQLATHKRKKYSHIWPIDPSSAAPPVGWQGWPQGKKFALVLSHDVDGRKGYDNCLKLAELEEKLGFRSNFNFVPECYGQISLGLLDELRSRGFEVAVHGLKHDGRLFLSKSIFDRQAARINAYLKKWKTEGFTSPSMLHNLDWTGALNIKYSISTFDTDPFEPQPDGVGTIFPFVVYKKSAQHSACPLELRRQPDYSTGAVSSQLPSPPSEGSTSDLRRLSSVLCPLSSAQASEIDSFFIEMPYTVPQDSTLFVILRDMTIDIWKRKLDWIAEKGAMALLNTHPDYMNDKGRWGREEYPMRFFEEFLHYVREEYEGQYWHVLTKEIASFWREKVVMANRQIQNKAGRLGS